MRLLAAAIVALGALAACGEREPSSAAPRVELKVRVSDGEGQTARATLECRGRRARVTGFLRRARSRPCGFARREARFLASRPDPDRVCTEVFGGPDTARVTGRIGKRRVDRRFSRSDGCAIADWDRASRLFAGAPGSRLRRDPA